MPKEESGWALADNLASEEQSGDSGLRLEDGSKIAVILFLSIPVACSVCFHSERD